MLQNVEPTAISSARRASSPKLEHSSVIDQILEDEDTPKKQRQPQADLRTLRDEHDYTVPRVRFAVSRSIESVTRRSSCRSPNHRARPIRLREAVVVIADIRMKAALAVMSLPYSDAFHVTLTTECTETFQRARNSFEFFEGATKIAYDNTSVAVKKVLEGPNRELTTEFLHSRVTPSSLTILSRAAQKPLEQVGITDATPRSVPACDLPTQLT